LLRRIKLIASSRILGTQGSPHGPHGGLGSFPFLLVVNDINGVTRLDIRIDGEIVTCRKGLHGLDVCQLQSGNLDRLINA
jgi:hypothetical protein